MNNNMNLTRRIMAMFLTLCMMLSSLSGYVPGWFAAFAEEAVEEAAPAPAPAPAPEPAPAPKPAEAPKQESKPAEAPKQESKPAEAPKQESKPAEAPKQESKPAEAPKQEPESAEPKSAEEPKPAEQASKPAEETKASDQSSEAVAHETSSTEPTEEAAERSAGATQDAGTDEDASSGEGESAPEGDRTEEQNTETAPDETSESADTVEVPEASTGVDEIAVPQEDDAAPQEDTADLRDEAVDTQEDAADAQNGDFTSQADEEASPEEIAEETAEETAEEAVLMPLGVGLDAAMNTAVELSVEGGVERVTMAAVNAQATDEEDEKSGVSVLQQEIIKALTGSKLSGKIQIILERNVTYEGNSEDGKIVIDAAARDIADDFELELLAEDAGNNGVEGEGYTIIDANVIVRGAKVVMKSVMIAADKAVTVQQEIAEGVNKGRVGALVYYGTEALPNELTVDVGAGGSAVINTMGNDDIINVATRSGAIMAQVNAGDGLNTVNVTHGGGYLEVVTGSSNDTVNVTIGGDNNGVRVDTGASTDYITIVNGARASASKAQIPDLDANGNQRVDKDGNPIYKSTGSYDIDTGDGDDQLTLDVRADAGNMTINTGLGAAAVTVMKGDNRTVENLDYSENSNVSEAIKAGNSGNATITFINGDDSAEDRFTVDANTGLAVDKLHFKGGKASVYLRGKLDANTAADDRMKAIDNGFEMHVASGQDTADTATALGLTLKVTADDLAKMNFTDALKNKRRVELYPTASGTYNVTASDNFTDYVIKTPVKTNVGTIKVGGSDGPLLLSNLVLDADEMGDDDVYIPTIDAQNLNVLIKAPVINIDRAITAQNVRAESALGSLSLGGVFEEFDAGVSLGDIVADLFDSYDAAVVNVNAAITTAHDIALVARVKHFGGLFSLLPASLDLVNVKIADAEVNINSGAKLNAGGSVEARAKIETAIGYTVETDKDNKTTTQTKEGGPIGIDVVSNNASVNVAKGASVVAKEDVTLAASSDVRVYNYANYGAFVSPVALTVTSVTNKANVRVDGAVTAGRKAKLDASGSVSDDTASSYVHGKNAALGGAVGGFVAINVVDQDVNAVIGKDAVVTAQRGDVAVYTSRVADVKTIATAGGDQKAEESSPVAGSFVGLLKALGGKLFAKFKGSIVDKEMESFVKTVHKVSASDYSVKVVEPTEDSADKGTTTVKTKVGDKLDKDGSFATYGVVEPKPKDGYKVESVVIRYLEKGSDHYTYAEVAKNSYGQYIFPLESADVEVMVTYGQNEGQNGGQAVDVNADDLEDAFEIPHMLQDVLGGVADKADDDDDFVIEGGAENVTSHRGYKLAIDNGANAGFITGGGKIVTWKTTDDRKNITDIWGGQKIRLVPNPDDNKQLASLSVVYTHTVDGAEVTETIDITADSQGRYIFDVPEDVDAGTTFRVKAVFGDAEGEAKQPAHKQVTGALAIGVTQNKGASTIQSGSTVSAGGAVDMFGFTITDTVTNADGTAISPETVAKEIAAAQNDPKPTQKLSYNVPGANTGLKISATLPGKITSDVKPGSGGTLTNPKITYTPGEGYAIGKVQAIVTYYTTLNVSSTKGKRTSETIDVTVDSDGNYVLDLSRTKYMSVDGTTVDVTFLCETADGQLIESDAQGAVNYAVPNPIRTSVSALKDGKETVDLGKLTFTRYDDNNGKPLYYFTLFDVTDEYVEGHELAAGYKCDPMTGGSTNGVTTKSNTKALYASWVGADGETHKAALMHDSSCGLNEWYFKTVDGNTAVPAGALVTIFAVFSPDKRDVEIKYEDENADGETYGTATVSKNAAKQGDKLTVTLTEKDGWYPVSVSVLLKSGKRLDEKYIVNKGNGVWEITAPKFEEGEKLTITPLFNGKTVKLQNTGADVQVSGADKDGMAAKGQVITIMPTADDIKAGRKLDVANTTVTYNGTKLTVSSDGKVTIPNAADDTDAQTTLTINAALKEKEYEVTAYESADGDKISPVSGKVDPGETLTLNIEPRAGYRAKQGTVKVTITVTKNGSASTRQVVAKWAGQKNTYTVAIPNLDAGEKITSIRLSGEFEKGSDDVELSMGVAVAVDVTRAENILEIQGDADVTTGDGLSMVGVSIASEAETEAKAGYNQGDTGVAGAIAVQVAKTLTDVAVRTGAKLTEVGDIFILAKAKQDFKVTGDASGKKDGNEAEGTGVGAGIAIAVDSLETSGVIEDGVVLRDKSKVTDITINVNHKDKDQVTAKAGAAGGTAVVPVAAVDAFASKAKAELGRLTGEGLNNGALDVSGGVSVKASGESAKVQYNHEVNADASARGDSAVGAAFIVTWLENDVKALLNQSLNATGDVSLKTVAGDALKAVAKAAASGGEAGEKDEKGEGSADKQANKLLKGAGNLGGRYGDMDGGAIADGANDRQKAETAEQTVTGAGAFVLNIMKNSALSEIANGVDVATEGKLSVHAANRTDATVKADASATHSDVGVGIGVAINIVTMENIARIGDGAIAANELEVVADIAQAPTKVRPVTIAEDESAFSSALESELTEAIRALLGNKVADTLGEALGTVVGQLAKTLIDDLNLGSLFKLLGGDAGSTFTKFADQVWSRLKALPQVLAQPLIQVCQEVVGSYENLAVEGGVMKLFTDAWNDATAQLGSKLAEQLKKTLPDAGKNLAGGVLDMITDKVNGKGSSADKLKQALTDTVTNGLKELLDEMITVALRDIGSSIPVLNETNVEVVKRLSKTSFDELKKSIVPYIAADFRQTVWDYQPVVEKIQSDGFVGTIKNTLRDMLKNSAVAMTNEAIDKVLGVLDVNFDREEIEDRHIITTQAIAGAGAKNTSGAGSLAIAVANLTTTAEILGGDGAVTVDGDMTVDAEELRRVRTHSTAAVDERGEADNNEGAEDSANADVGGGEASGNTFTSPDGQYPKVTVNAGVGGTVDFSHYADDGYIYIKPDDGFKIDFEHLSEVFQRTYDKVEMNDDGELVATSEVKDQPEVEKIGDHLLIYPANGTGMEYDRDAMADFCVSLDIQFTELLRELPQATLSTMQNEERNLPEYTGQITMSVEGREQDEFGGVWARTNDLAEINVPTQAGLKVKSISVTYDKDGEDDSLSYGFYDDAEDDEIRLASSNADEEVYVFKVPVGKVKYIKVIFAEDDDEERTEMLRKAEKDRAGRTVGVGAAFTLTYGNSEVSAEIGKRDVTAGTLAVTASSEHEEENYATAGTDPFEGTSDDIKDFALDAAVSLNILDNDVRAVIAEGGSITTTAVADDEETEDETEEDIEEEEVEEEKEEDAPEEIEVTPGSLVVSATEVGSNETKASAFSAGSATAVGASVAVNVSLSDIAATLDAAAEVSGKAVVRTHTLSKDDTWAFASAMGADMQRKLNEVADLVDYAEEEVNGVTSGDIYDKKPETKTTDTNAKINERLNKDGVKQEGGDEARDDLNVSTNVLRSQKVRADGGEDAADGANEANGFVDVDGGQALSGYTSPNKTSKLQVAAAVGVTVALHKAAATVNKAVSAAEDILVSATNAGNFNTRSTGMAMTLAKGKGKTIAAAVGVSVNNNEAHAAVNGNLTSAEGNIAVSADLKQNLTDTYAGRLAVQSIAGAVSGKGSDASVGGAISMLVSYAQSDAIVNGDLSGGDVSVTANDKSKLAVRAGGVSISKGANVGMGVSVATIWSGNTVRAEVKDGRTIDADSFTLKAVKAPVTFDDYNFPLSFQDMISDSSDLDDEERENIYPGLIDVHRKPGEKSYTVDINMDTYAMMKLADFMNFLSSKNYYTEAIAGSVNAASADTGEPNAANAAGSISIVRALNRVEAVLGSNVTINKKGKRAEGDVTILAQDDTTARMIGGAAAVGKAKNSVGVTLTFLYDGDEAKASAGDNLNINAANVRQSAASSTHVESYNVAASVATAAQDTKSVGGGLDVVLLNNTAKTVIGNDATIDASGKLDITADSGLDLLLVSASASVAKRATAAGGTISFGRNSAEATVEIGENHKLAADGDVTIAGRATDKIINIIASASAAITGKTGAAGAVNVLVDKAKGKVTLAGGGNGITSNKGSVSLLGETETRAVNATVAAAGSKGKAIGISANISVLQRESGVEVAGGAGYAINAARDVLVSGYGKDYSLAVSMAVAGSAGNGLGLSGNLPVLVSRNKVITKLGSVNVNAGGEAAFASRLDDTTKAAAGSLALSLSNNAAAATAMFVNKENEVTVDMGSSAVTAAGNAGTLANKLHGETFNGLYVGAKVVDDVVAIAAGVAAAGQNGITGNALWTSNKNKVKADASNASLAAVAKNVGGTAIGGGDATVEASNDSRQIVLSGGINGAGKMAAGASLTVLTAAKEVTAKAHDVKAWNDVNVTAENDDDVFEMALSAGGSGVSAAEIGLTFQTLKSKVNASVASEIEAVRGSFNLKSVNDVNLDNTAVAIAGAGKNAVAPVFALTLFSGESNAKLEGGSVKAGNGVNVSATADKDMGQYTVGAAASGKLAVSGAVSVASLKDTANALVADGTTINANTLDVTAESDLNQLGASMAIAGAGKDAVAVNGMLIIAKGNALAEMAGSATLKGKANVAATSKRDIADVVETAGVGGEAGVGVTIMGIVAGEKMDQDAADTLTYGSADTSGDKTFDVDAMVNYMKEKRVDTADIDGSAGQSSLADDLSGNGNRNADMNVGADGLFDGTSGVVDDGSFEGDGNANENKQATDTADIERAKHLGTSAYSADPTDSVVARIAATANVSASGVDVNAKQDTRADIFGAAVAYSILAGVGSSVGIAMLRSNVIASSEGNVDAKDGAVNVTAASVSGSASKLTSTAEQQRAEYARTGAINGALKDSDDSELQENLKVLKDMVAKRSIRVVGIAAGLSNSAGVGIAGSVVRTDNITRATVGGSVKNASALNVDATTDYGNVSALTLAIGGGEKMGVAAAFAVAMANGTVEARLDQSANITGANTKIGVTTNSVVNANALTVTAAAAGGDSETLGIGVAASAGVAVASNQLKQNTLVDRGARIAMTGNNATLNVKGTSATRADSYLLGVSVAAAAAGLGAGASIVKPTLNTSIGATGATSGQTALGKLATVNVQNDVTSTAAANLLSLAGGLGTMQGNVLLVFNETDATAKVANASGTLGSLKINGELGATGRSRFASAAVGNVAAGMSVAYVDVDSENNAILDTDNFTATVTDDLTVSTGENANRRTLADARSLAAALAGTAAVSLNAAVARNRAENNATITGKNGITAGTVNLTSKADGTADARFYGLSVGGMASVAGSVDVALNETTSKAVMKLGGALDASLNAASDVVGDTTAKMYTGSGALFGAKVNVAVAYGRTNAIIDVEAAKGPTASKKININAATTGKDAVTTTIDNQSLEAFSVAAMVGTAYSQDVYSARVKLGEGNYDASKVSVTTDYDTTATASVTPSAAGVDLSLAKIAVNYAGAKSTAYAGSELALSDGAILSADGDVAVRTAGKAATDSKVNSTKFVTLNVVGIGVAVSESELSGTQAATLRMDGGEIAKADAVKVESLTDKAQAHAAVGTSGVGEDDQTSVSVSLVNVDVNSANAKENLASTAAILGSGRDSNAIKANSLVLRADTALEDVKDENGKVIGQKNIDTEAKSKTSKGLEIGIVSGGGLLADATSTDSFNAVMSGVAAEIAGDASLSSSSSTVAGAEGVSPGTWAAIDVSVTEMEARVGASGDRQTSKVLIDDNTTLNAGGALTIAAKNNGNAYTDLDPGTSGAAIGIKVCKLPTESWYDTGVSIGKNSELSAGTAANITAASNTAAKSTVVAKGGSLAFDVTYTRGKNTVDSENNVDIGDGAIISAEDVLNIAAASSAQMNAQTSVYSGGAIAGEAATAQNALRRADRVTIADNVNLTSGDGDLNITAASGEADEILTKSYVEAGGVFLLGNAKAETEVTSDSEILVGQNVLLTAEDDLNLLARATSHVAESDSDEEEEDKKEGEGAGDKGKDAAAEVAKKKYGVNTDAVVETGSLGIDSAARADVKLNYNTFISINRDNEGENEESQLLSSNADINVRVDNEGMTVYTHTKADSKGIGYSKAESIVEANLGNTIWVDNANLYSEAMTNLLASNAGKGKKPSFTIESLAEMYGPGTSDTLSKLTGLPFNQIRTYNARLVDAPKKSFTHIAVSPVDSAIVEMSAKESNTTTGWSITRKEKYEVNTWKEGAKNRCDFCVTGEGISVVPSDRVTDNGSIYDKKGVAERSLRSGVTKALKPLEDIRGMLKVLSPLLDIQRAQQNKGSTKARYGEEDYLMASQIYALDMAVPLKKDVTFGIDKLKHYRLWTNTATQMDACLLPNAARLYGYNLGDTVKLHFAADVLAGDIRGDGELHNVDIITALTDYAVKNPVIPVGSTGSLDFASGELVLPSQADFELYLHEVSAGWLLGRLGERFIRRLDADQDAINAYALTEDAELPEGRLIEGLTDGGMEDGWRVYWWDDTPETAKDDEQTLIYLLVNEATDEVDAFRTSAAMIAAGEESVDVSALFYRDDRADRMGEEFYDVMFFDTPEGEKSIVKIVTNVLADRTLELPRALRVGLRRFSLAGADWPVFSLSDHFFAMCDGTDGKVSMFDEFYNATFDGDTFDSDYMTIAGILDGDLRITLKPGQPIWPEWTDKNAAEDIQGERYIRIDDKWYNLDDLPEGTVAA